MNEEPLKSLGTCCLCETDKEVRNILSLPKKSPTPGAGWGCMICELPPDGAMAVVCDACLEQIRAGVAQPKLACRGEAATGGRIPIEELQGEHAHVMARHVEYMKQRTGFALGGEDIEALGQTVLQVEIDGVMALQLLGALQLVARHPNFQGPTAVAVIEFARFLQGEISTTPSLAAIAAEGWLVEHDQPVIEVPEPNRKRIIVPGE